MEKYKIVRFFSPDQHAKGKEDYVVKRGLTLEEAQEHCRDSKTKKEGEWFDGYAKDR